MRSGPWLWLLPLTVLLLVFVAYPFLEIIRLSFTNAQLGSDTQDYTFANYIRLLNDSSLGGSLGVTLTFATSSVVLQLLAGLTIAIVLYEAERRRIRGTVFVRTIVLASWAVPGVVVGIVWLLLLQESESGVINFMLSGLGMNEPVAFLSDPNVALVSAVAASVWRGTAMSMIFCYAGLQTIPEDVREAAAMDGASWWQVLVRIVIPMLIPLLTLNIVVVTVETFNVFDLIMVLTGGGPGQATEVLSLRIYDLIFTQLDIGNGAAAAVLLLLIDIAFVAIFLSYRKRRTRD